jgi:hypothetical protein
MRDAGDVIRGGVGAARTIVLAILLPLLVLAVVATTFGITAVDDAQTEAAESGAAAGHRLAAIADAWPALDAVAREVAAPVRADDPDRDALRELLAGTMPLDSLRAAPVRFGALDADTAAWVRRGTPAPSALAAGPSVAHGVRADLPVQLDAATRQRFARDTSSPWLAVWRRAAAVAEPPAAWQYRVGARGVDGLVRAPGLDVDLYRALGWTNEEAAILELERGTPDAAASALRRARENVAMAHVLARSTRMAEYVAGHGMLLDAARLLRFVGERTGDSAAARDGGRLHDAAWRLLPVSAWAVGPRAPDADTAIAMAVAMAGDRRLPPAVRAGSVVEVMLASSCLAPAPMVLGPATSLDLALRDVRLALRDLDPEARLAPAIARSRLEWIALTHGEGWRAQRRDVPAWAEVLPAVGLGGLTGRLFVCAER